jgi:adenylate kinase family enzyme
MRVAITGASGNGKTTLAAELERVAGLRHIETDALHHGPNWESCGADVLRERVLSATEGDDWVLDSSYHGMIGYTAADRADLVLWLDLPLRVTLRRLVRRTWARRRKKVELWNGNLEPGGWDAVRYLIWPAIRTSVTNRRVLPKRYEGYELVRLRSDAEVRAFVQSIQAQAAMSGSSRESARQNTPPFVET